MSRSLCYWLLCLLFTGSSADAAQRVILQGNGKLAIVKPDGSTDWEMNWGGIHDIHVLNGHILVQQGAAKVAEIDPSTKQVVWSYDSATQNGNAGKKVEVHAFQPLENGRLMIAESGPARIIEVDRDGKLLKEVKLKVTHPDPHTDTRLARKLTTGNYLVCHEGEGFVSEYDNKSGEIVWEYEVPLFGKQPKGGHGPEAFGNKYFAAVRLPNDHTLIATGNALRANTFFARRPSGPSITKVAFRGSDVSNASEIGGSTCCTEGLVGTGWSSSKIIACRPRTAAIGPS